MKMKRRAFDRANLSTLACALAAAFLVSCPSFGQSGVGGGPRNPEPGSNSTGGEITVTGCLLAYPEAVYFNDGSEDFNLDGDINELTKLAGSYQPITIRGTRDNSTHPPTLRINSIKVGETPRPSLNPEFRQPSKWHVEKNVKYGVRFAYPKTLKFTAEDDKQDGPNFAKPDGSVTLASLGLPRDVYPDSNFYGGSFSIFVNPTINDSGSCARFADYSTQDLSPEVIHGVTYREAADGSIGTGHSHQGYEYFHTFQHGLCYEVVFTYDEGNTHIADGGCLMTGMAEHDIPNIRDLLMKEISFFPPKMDAKTRKLSN